MSTESAMFNTMCFASAYVVKKSSSLDEPHIYMVALSLEDVSYSHSYLGDIYAMFNYAVTASIFS